jgi:hypothetical protein
VQATVVHGGPRRGRDEADSESRGSRPSLWDEYRESLH